MKSKKRNLPKTLIVGPKRTGTTWVYNYLKSRDDTNLPKGVKETFFFDKNYNKGEGWYSSHFKKGENKTALEVGSSYFHSSKAPKRIYKILGNIPIIVNKRDPVERSYSHFKHAVRYGHAPNNIEKAIEQNSEILNASLYNYHLKRWRNVFGNGNIHILDFNLISKAPRKYLVKLCDILEIEFIETDFEIYNAVNKGQDVRFSILNGGITKIANILRSYKAYPMINFAKRIGLKNAIYGGENLKEGADAVQVKRIIKQKLNKKRNIDNA